MTLFVFITQLCLYESSSSFPDVSFHLYLSSCDQRLASSFEFLCYK